MAKKHGMNRFAIFVLGVISGLTLALLAIGVIIFGPNPFETGKVTLGTQNVDPSAALNGGVDPNQRLNEVEGLTVPTSEAQKGGRPAVSTVAAESTTSHPPQYWIQAGSFAKMDGAIDRQGQLALNGLEAKIQARNKRYLVMVGPYNDRVEAIEDAQRLKADGFETQVLSTPTH